MLYKKIDKDPQMRFYISHCRYCGKPFIKVENRSTLCSYRCKVKSTQDSKAEYQRKRRKAINDGELISNETNQIGTSTVYLSKKIKPSFEEEHSVILKEKKRVGLISQ
jgi:GTP-dependent phosphoenolpyruvate carboxykinase